MSKPHGTAKRHEYHDQAVALIMEGHAQPTIVAALRKQAGLSIKQAELLHGEALRTIADQPDKGAGWHKLKLLWLIETAGENLDLRIVLEALRDLRKVEALADGEKRAVDFELSKEGLLAFGADVVRRMEAGKMGVAKAQAIAQLVQSLAKLQDVEEDVEELGERPKMGEVELSSKVADGIIDIGSWTPKKG